MFVRYVGASGLRISASEFTDNLERKRGDKQFRQISSLCCRTKLTMTWTKPQGE
jgi:hypothetical protein